MCSTAAGNDEDTAVMTSRILRRAKFQSNITSNNTNALFFYTPDSLSLAEATVSKH